ncbi:MAG: copper resistance protein CopC [Dehalococcoidia bacterium]
MTRPRSRTLMLGAAAVLVTVAALGAPSLGGYARALAHAEVDRASPAIDSTIPEAPAQLEVWFTQELFRRTGANTLEVTASDGTSAVSGDPVIDDDDRTHMTVPLNPNLEAGTYTVTWHSLSAVDGDEAEGSFTFTIDPSVPATTATPEATAAAEVTVTPAPETATPPPATVSTDGAGFPWWAVVAAAAVLAAGGIGAWTLRAPAEADSDIEAR